MELVPYVQFQNGGHSTARINAPAACRIGSNATNSKPFNGEESISYAQAENKGRQDIFCDKCRTSASEIFCFATVFQD
jgi:hypothetical protein